MTDHRLHCIGCHWRWEPLVLPPILLAGDRCRNPNRPKCWGVMRKGWE